jgi:hypothetical protein
VRILEGYVWLCTKRPDRVEAAAQTFADVLEEVKARYPPTLDVLKELMFLASIAAVQPPSAIVSKFTLPLLLGVVVHCSD